MFIYYIVSTNCCSYRAYKLDAFLLFMFVFLFYHFNCLNTQFLI